MVLTCALALGSTRLNPLGSGNPTTTNLRFHGYLLLTEHKILHGWADFFFLIDYPFFFFFWPIGKYIFEQKTWWRWAKPFSLGLRVFLHQIGFYAYFSAVLGGGRGEDKGGVLPIPRGCCTSLWSILHHRVLPQFTSLLFSHVKNLTPNTSIQYPFALSYRYTPYIF